LTKYALGQVTTAKLGPKCVTTAKIADSAVQTLQIDDGAVLNVDVNAAAAIVRAKLALPTLVGLLDADKTPANTSALAWTTLYARVVTNAEANATRIIVHVQGKVLKFIGTAGPIISHSELRVANGATGVGTPQTCSETTFAIDSVISTPANLVVPLIAGVDYVLGTGFTINIQGISVRDAGLGADQEARYHSSAIYEEY